MTNDIAGVEDRLYGADLDEFVKERTAAAKALRGDGRREDAAAVAKLAKPSVAAWIVNRLARDERKPVGALLDAGARLRDVQLGAGSAADLRKASQAQEAALRSLMRSAERIAGSRGSATSATLDRVRETLHAAALDAGLAEHVRRGVLVREERAVGFPAGIAVPAERRRASAATPASPRAAPKPAGRNARPEQRDEVAAKRRERAEAAAQAARAGLATAKAERDAARRALDTATRALADARRTVAELSQRVDAGRRGVDRAEKAHARATKLAAQALGQLEEIRGRE